MGHERHSLRSAVMLIAVLVYVSAIGQVRTSAQPKAAACPLTDAQTSKSIDAFKPIANFLTTEPRCFNCHGGVNPFVDGTGLDPEDSSAPASKLKHGGGLITRQGEKAADGTRLIEGECRDCHNHMADRSGGGHSVWTTAPSFLSFVDKDATTLCRQIKRATGTAEHFLGHLEDDNGGNTFAKTAFIGDRGLDPDQFLDKDSPTYVKPEPPSIKHPAVMQLARNWVAAMGGSFKGDESCGCEFKHAKWSGQIHITYDSSGGASDDQATSSHRQFSQITLTFNDGVGTAASQATVTAHIESRRYVVDNGHAHLIKEETIDTDGSGSQTVPATVEVAFHQNGEYSVQPGWSPQPVGQSTTDTCHYSREGAADCKKTELRLYAETYRAGELSEKTSDPNHVTGSKAEGHEDQIGGKTVGRTMRVVRWDLWRSN
jgi:hypothetical protein